MISCVLQGGIGNQSHIIATTIATALKNNSDYAIPSETTPPNIKRFGKHFDFPEKHPAIKSVWEEPSDQRFKEIEYTDGMCLHGYFQSYKYFQGYEKEIREALGFKKVETDYVAVHVRRGDYKHYPDTHPIVSKEYIWEAMRRFYGIGLRKFMFFSDDLAWCKENFKGYDYSEMRSAKQDMELIMNCKHTIISNSSFSLFASLLNFHQDKKVIAPNVKKWFGNSGLFTGDLLPDSYIQIECL